MSGSGALSLPLLPQVRDASGCGCGTGQGVATPLQIYNRAGLPAVQYRIGDQASFKATLLSRLAAADYPALAVFFIEGEPSVVEQSVVDEIQDVAEAGGCQRVVRCVCRYVFVDV